jgi:hypothetical protein
MGGNFAGNKTDKSEAIASRRGRNWYNLKCWEWICKVGMGIHRQAMAGVMGFLTFEEIWNDSKKKKNVHIEVFCMLESQFSKVRVGVSGFQTFENIWDGWNYNNANNFLGFKTPKKYAYQIPQYFRSRCWKKTRFHFKLRQAISTLVQNDCQPEIGYTTIDFLKINKPTITLTLHCSSTMVGGHEQQSDSNATSTSSSASASAVSADWDFAPPLQNVRVDTQYVEIIEEQKKQIKQLQEELAEFNCAWYRTLPVNASRGKNVLRTSRKMSMTAADHINQQAVASYIREVIWPGNKMLPKSWSKWRDDKRSLCQMILK